MKVLLIGDDPQLARTILHCLHIGYENVAITPVNAVEQIKKKIGGESFDLIIEDSPFSELNTVELIYQIRDLTNTPLVILGPAEENTDILLDLEAGADEYFPKPLNLLTFLARCKALLRRAKGFALLSEDLVSIDNLSINFTTREVFISNKPIKLTPIEFGLLSKLAKYAGKVVTNHELMSTVWGSDYIGDSDLIKAAMWRLRSKLKNNYGDTLMIDSVHGLGYRFTNVEHQKLT